MADLFHYWGEDLQPSASGDLLLVQALDPNNAATLSGNDEATQRIYRRIMTDSEDNDKSDSGEYIFEPNYGGGIPGKIGARINVPAWTGLFRAQMAQETAVSQSPQPQVTMSTTGVGAVQAVIQYMNIGTGTSVSLTFDPTGNS